jgi:hypothetical protein
MSAKIIPFPFSWEAVDTTTETEAPIPAPKPYVPNRAAKVTDLKGETMLSVTGMDKDSDVVTFTSESGHQWTLYHRQDCCESVSIEDVIGDPADLVGAPILMAEDVSRHYPDDQTYKDEEWGDVSEWTFYKFATIKGYVTLRWYGTSNGYYSTDVDFKQDY